MAKKPQPVKAVTKKPTRPRKPKILKDVSEPIQVTPFVSEPPKEEAPSQTSEFFRYTVLIALLAGLPIMIWALFR